MWADSFAAPAANVRNQNVGIEMHLRFDRNPPAAGAIAIIEEKSYP